MKAGAGLVHIHAEAIVLDFRQPASDAQDEAPVAEVIQHGHLLGDAHGVVPGQDADHAAQLQIGGAAGHVGEELEHVGAHGVVGEVVLHAPDGLETQGFGQLGKTEFVPVHPSSRR